MDFKGYENKYLQGWTIKQCAVDVGCGYGTMQRYIKSLGISRTKSEVQFGVSKGRKYFINESFFDTINTEEKAYWLGFFLADGCKTDRGIQIGLQRKDKEHLQKFLFSIDSFHNIYDYNYGYEQSVVSIKSRKLASKVVKSFEEMPVLPKELERHFWRGVFDGDGHIGFHKNKQRKNYNSLHCVLVGTKEICDGFKEFLLANKIKTEASVLTIKNTNCYKFATSGTNLTKSIHSLLYDNSNVSLDRKRGVVGRGF